MLAVKICVIIPAYNAAGTVGPVVAGALKHCHDIIVADDGSTDDTAEVAARAGAKTIKISPNKGKGNALKLLFETAITQGYDAVISVDADGQHDPDEIPLFIDAHARHPDDIIVGSRMGEKGKIPRARLNSMQVANYYSSLAANQYLEDTQCGFRLYPLSLIKRVALTTERYVTETEILIKAGDSGAHVCFIDIKALYNKHGSHFRPINDVASITAFILPYLIIKWAIELVCVERPYTYSPGKFRDSIGQRGKINSLFQGVMALSTLPLTILFLGGYVLIGPFKNNFASIRMLGCGYLRIVAATFMLPVVLAVSVIEKSAITADFGKRLTDRVVGRFYQYPRPDRCH